MNIPKLCGDYDQARQAYDRAQTVDDSRRACQQMEMAKNAILSRVQICREYVQKGVADFKASSALFFRPEDYLAAVGELTLYNTWMTEHGGWK